MRNIFRNKQKIELTERKFQNWNYVFTIISKKDHEGKFLLIIASGYFKSPSCDKMLHSIAIDWDNKIVFDGCHNEKAKSPAFRLDLKSAELFLSIPIQLDLFFYENRSNLEISNL